LKVGVIKFGTDGWRGIIAKDFTFDRLAVAAAAVGQVALEREDCPTAFVGYDRRFLSREFAEETAKVLAAQGLRVLLSKDFCTTPCASFVARRESTPLSPMVTASHNPAIYNGLKVKGPHGGPATPDQVKPVQERATQLEDSGFTPPKVDFEEALKKGLITEIDATADYLEAVKKHIETPVLRKCNLKVVVDCMHGAGSGALKKVLDDFGVQSIEIRSENNPAFGGVNPEPIEPNLGVLIDRVRETGADLGLAMDGDADRLGVVDEKGRYVTTQEVFTLVLQHIVEDRGMRTGDVVKTATSSSMLDVLAKSYGLNLVETAVGFKEVCSYMLEHDTLLGGEESGGYTIRGHLPERDGLLCGVLLLEMMTVRGQAMSEIVTRLMEKAGYHTYRRIDVHTTQEKKEEALRRVKENPPVRVGGLKVDRVSRLDGYKAFLDDGSWLLVRASGTEPVLRIYCEAVADSSLDKILEDAQRFLLED
jgi:phosphomannomutase